MYTRSRHSARHRMDFEVQGVVRVAKLGEHIRIYCGQSGSKKKRRKQTALTDAKPCRYPLVLTILLRQNSRYLRKKKVPLLLSKCFLIVVRQKSCASKRPT